MKIKEPEPAPRTDKGFRVTTLHAFLAVDPNDNDVEGVIASRNHLGEWTPLICADQARIDSLRPIAQRVATTTGLTVKLAKFSIREDVGEIKP